MADLQPKSIESGRESSTSRHVPLASVRRRNYGGNRINRNDNAKENTKLLSVSPFSHSSISTSALSSFPSLFSSLLAPSPAESPSNTTSPRRRPYFSIYLHLQASRLSTVIYILSGDRIPWSVNEKRPRNRFRDALRLAR